MQVFHLTGIVETGDDHALGVPADPRVHLRLSINVAATLHVAVISPSGAPFDISGKQVVFTVKKNLNDTVPLIRKVATPNPARGLGQADVALAPLDWNLCAPGSYLYDLWLSDTNVPPLDAAPILASAPLSLLPTVFSG